MGALRAGEAWAGILKKKLPGTRLPESPSREIYQVESSVTLVIPILLGIITQNRQRKFKRDREVNVGTQASATSIHLKFCTGKIG